MDRGAVTSVRDLESNTSSYAPLPGGGDDVVDKNHDDDGSSWLNTRVLALTLATALLLVLGAAFLHVHGGDGNVNLNAAINVHPDLEGVTPRRPRGVEEGVSNKESGVHWAENENKNALKAAGSVGSYGWTNDELRWQRTGFHFQPPKNWMNDPNGPLYYKGWYHLFYQYNPDSAVWGNITWGHAVSDDLINWNHLPLAIVRDHWYDANGVWTGSATVLPDGRVVMLYTGSTNESVQVQNLAFPADISDPLLLDWVKSESNPVLFPPAGIDHKDFRDPTTAWYEPSESAWRIAIGSKNVDGAGISLVYRTTDFMKYELLPELLHVVPGTGMWECVDFYPVSKAKEVGLDTSVNGPEVKHVLKVSLDDDRNDYYAIGTYDRVGGKWTPDDPEVDLGIGARYDYGRFYAAKSFYDQDKQRRVIWGWIGEADSERADIAKGWASLMAIPRTVRLDEKTGSNLLQWPVEEVERLRTARTTYSDVNIAAGSVVPLDVGKASQLDINVEFEVSEEALKAAMEANVTYNCSTSAGAAGRGVLGPFGLLVLADEGRTEQTAVYFYVAKAAVGKLGTFICHDEMRSSKADDTEKKLQGSIVPVLDGENLSLRILVDHSVVETFAQGGRTCITSRVYPTNGIHQTAWVFLFNNATDASVIAKSVDVWNMNSAFLRPYSSTQMMSHPPVVSGDDLF